MSSDISSDDGWAFSLRHHFNHDLDDSDVDDDALDPKDAMSSESQFLHELDIGARPDEAKFVANPWSIAKVNAASRPKPQNEKEKTGTTAAVPSSTGRKPRREPKGKQTRGPKGFKQTFFAPNKPSTKAESRKVNEPMHTSNLSASDHARATSDARDKRMRAIHDALEASSSVNPSSPSHLVNALPNPAVQLAHPHDVPPLASPTATPTHEPKLSPRLSMPPQHVLISGVCEDHEPCIEPSRSLCAITPSPPAPRVPSPPPPPPARSTPYLDTLPEPSQRLLLRTHTSEHRSPMGRHLNQPLSSSNVFTVQIPRHQALLVTRTGDEGLVFSTPNTHVWSRPEPVPEDHFMPNAVDADTYSRDWVGEPETTMPSLPPPPPAHRNPAVMPQLLANAFASQRHSISEPPVLASAFASRRQNVLYSPSVNCNAQTWSTAPDYDEALSSSPTVVGSSPPSSHLKDFHSLSRLPPPRVPAFEAVDRPQYSGAETSRSSQSSRPSRPSLPALRPQFRDSENAPRRAVDEASTFLRRHPPPCPPPKASTRSDPDEEWSSMVPRTRPAPSRTAVPVRRSGAFRLPLAVTSAISTGTPVTARVQTFVPPAPRK